MAKNLNALLSALLLCAMFTGSAMAGGTSSSKREHKAKYIFYFIGDGMSIPQIRIAESAKAEASFNANYYKQVAGTADAKVSDNTLNIRRLKTSGMATTHAANRYITGSAAAATALATGYKTSINTISMNAERTQNMQTIAEAAKANGYKVGIITSVSIDHATPACFYAHTKDRSNYEEIGDYLLNSGFDYFGGGSIKNDSYKKSVDEYKKAAEVAGFKYVSSRADFDALNNKSGRVIATLKKFDNSAADGCSLPYVIDIDEEKADDRIMLSEFTEKGIELLDNSKGFFMMIEGGKIDWTGHANDLVANSYEVISFDKAIGKALEFYEKHPDETLIVVTGDHETGGLTIGFAGTYYETAFGKLSKQDLSYQALGSIVKGWSKKGDVTFDDAMKIVEERTGLGSKGLKLSEYEMKRLKTAFEYSMTGETSLSKEEQQLFYGGYDPFTVTVTHILNNKAGIDWTSFSHTALPVPVFAIGCGENLFNGFYDNTDIPKKIAQSAGFSSFAE